MKIEGVMKEGVEGRSPLQRGVKRERGGRQSLPPIEERSKIEIERKII